jgi:serine/threonine protein kinase
LDLIKKILCVDVVERLSAAECLHHPWITDTANNDAHMRPLDTMQHTMRARAEKRKPKEAQQQQQAMKVQEQLAKQGELSSRQRAERATQADRFGADTGVSVSSEMSK